MDRETLDEHRNELDGIISRTCNNGDRRNDVALGVAILARHVLDWESDDGGSITEALQHAAEEHSGELAAAKREIEELRDAQRIATLEDRAAAWEQKYIGTCEATKAILAPLVDRLREYQACDAIPQNPGAQDVVDAALRLLNAVDAIEGGVSIDGQAQKLADSRKLVASLEATVQRQRSYIRDIAHALAKIDLSQFPVSHSTKVATTSTVRESDQ